MKDDHLQTKIRNKEYERARSHTRQDAAGERVFDPRRHGDGDDDDSSLDEKTCGEVPVEEVELPFRARTQGPVEFVVFAPGQAVQAREPAVQGGDAEGRSGHANVNRGRGFGDVLEEEVEKDGQDAGAEHVDGNGDGDGDRVFG